MSENKDDLFSQLILGEPTVAKLTEPAIARSLEGFERPARREMSWIARAVQGALYASLRSADERPDRRSNAEIRDEILKLADDCSRLWVKTSRSAHPQATRVLEKANSRSETNECESALG